MLLLIRVRVMELSSRAFTVQRLAGGVVCLRGGGGRGGFPRTLRWARFLSLSLLVITLRYPDVHLLREALREVPYLQTLNPKP